MFRKLRNDAFYSQMGKLLLPIVLQNLLNAVVSSADVVMLNFVGESSIAAVSLATQYTTVLMMVFYGLGTGATMLCAQYFGKGDMRAIETVQGIALRFSMLLALLFAGMSAVFPELMMRLFTPEEHLIALGAKYLRIMSISYLCWSVTEVYISVLRSIGRVAVGTALNSFAAVLNIILNAVFIFGTDLGVQGVAIATSTSRLLELLLCFAVSARSKDIKLRFRYLFVRNKLLFRDFLRLSIPAMANDVVWSVGFSMYSVILGHLGEAAVAANSLASVVRNFGTVLCFGIASAGGVLLGQIIGNDRMDEARDGAKKTVKLTVLASIAGGLLILASIPFVLMYANRSFSDMAKQYLTTMMLINCYYVVGQAVNTTIIAGIFRAGGDSRFGLICDFIDMWIYAVPIGFIAAFWLKLPVVWVYFILCTDEFVKWPWVIKRYRSGKWLKNITRDDLFEES